MTHPDYSRYYIVDFHVVFLKKDIFFFGCSRKRPTPIVLYFPSLESSFSKAISSNFEHFLEFPRWSLTRASTVIY